MEHTLKRDFQGIVTCGVLGLLFWLVPAVFSSSLSIPVADIYLKYRALGMVLVSLPVLWSIFCLYRLRAGKNTGKCGEKKDQLPEKRTAKIMQTESWIILFAGAIGLAFWLIPDIIKGSLGIGLSEFYSKYEAVSIVMSVIIALLSVHSLYLLGKAGNSKQQ